MAARTTGSSLNLNWKKARRPVKSNARSWVTTMKGCILLILQNDSIWIRSMGIYQSSILIFCWQAIWAYATIAFMRAKMPNGHRSRFRRTLWNVWRALSNTSRHVQYNGVIRFTQHVKRREQSFFLLFRSVTPIFVATNKPALVLFPFSFV